MARLDRAGKAFLQALDEAGHGMPSTSEAGPLPPTPTAPASVGFSPWQGGGGEERWDFAMQWTEEWAPPLAQPAPSPPREPDVFRSETTAAIAKELGLGGGLTPRQLASRWRDFIWRNHPDRQPAHERERAGARVAIANALYDEARRKLAKTR